jgi:transcriptional regulator with XRE-family HTH domain
MKMNKPDLDPLCVAVKKTREACGYTQERFARRIGVALMTVSRFENGRAVPSDHGVLMGLLSVAHEFGLAEEALQFSRAGEEVWRAKGIDPKPRPSSGYISYGFSSRIGGLSSGSFEQWRLMAIARTAVLHYPDRIAAIEEAAGPARGLVDAVLKNADLEHSTKYRSLDEELTAHCDRVALQNLKDKK